MTTLSRSAASSATTDERADLGSAQGLGGRPVALGLTFATPVSRRGPSMPSCGRRLTSTQGSDSAGSQCSGGSTRCDGQPLLDQTPSRSIRLEKQ